MSLLDVADACINTLYSWLPYKKPKAEQFQKMCLIAHRGAHNNTDCFENTLAAFDKARKSGCWGIELDIHVTRDNIIVVNHDPDLKRLWQNPAVICDSSYEYIKSISENIPTLATVINIYGGRLHLFIEIKAPFLAFDTLKNVLSRLKPGIDYHIISLDAELLLSLTDVPASARLLVASANNTAYFCELSLKHQLGGVLGHYLLLTNKKIKQLKAANQQIGVGYVDSKNSLHREINRDINWVFSNKAAKIGTYLGSYLK